MDGIVTLLSMGFFLPTGLHVERIAPGINSIGWREQKVIGGITSHDNPRGLEFACL